MRTTKILITHNISVVKSKVDQLKSNPKIDLSRHHSNYRIKQTYNHILKILPLKSFLVDKHFSDELNNLGFLENEYIYIFVIKSVFLTFIFLSKFIMNSALLLMRVQLSASTVRSVIIDAETYGITATNSLNLYKQQVEHWRNITMCEFANQRFNQLIREISQASLYKKMVVWAQKSYLIKHLALQTLTPLQVALLVKRNFEKSAHTKKSAFEGLNNSFQRIWVLNEFKLFVWVSLAFVYSKNKILQNLNYDDYVFLQELFPRKSIDFMEYHIISILKQSKQIREKWTEDQELLLTQVINSCQFQEKEGTQSIRWSEVSFTLFINSNKNLFKSPQKCRQKWTNHLNPCVNRKKWSLEEDQRLFRQVSTHGLKWALISKIFDGSRTQHMIKNRFNSLIKKYQSKSNRGSLKKVIQKIHIDLFKTTIPYDSRQNSENIQKEIYTSMEQIYKNHSQSSQLKELTKPEKSEQQIEIEPQFDRKGGLNKLDLDSLLFSDTNVEIQIPRANQDEVELIQFEQHMNGFVIHDFVADFFS